MNLISPVVISFEKGFNSYPWKVSFGFSGFRNNLFNWANSFVIYDFFLSSRNILFKYILFAKQKSMEFGLRFYSFWFFVIEKRLNNFYLWSDALLFNKRKISDFLFQRLCRLNSFIFFTLRRAIKFTKLNSSSLKRTQSV